MKRYLPALTALTISLIGIAFTPSLKASESDEKTVITISGAVTIQGTLLQPGSYVLKLQDTQSSQDMVFVFNADETRLIALVRAIPAYRLQPSDKSELRFITRLQESQRLCTHGSIRASPLALSSGPEFRRGQKLCSLFKTLSAV